MLLHIVRSGENINKIADNYQCEVSDITSNNLHITDFSHLQPGMKLRIPFLTKETIEVLEETESFIKDYYPSFTEKNLNLKPENKDSKPEVINEEILPKNEEIIEAIEKVEKEPVVEKIPLLEESKKNVVKPNVYPSCYTGNIVPKIPDKFIRKI